MLLYIINQLIFSEPIIDQSSGLENASLVAQLAFLNHAVEPWETVEDYWKETFNQRQETENDISLKDYFEKYPALKQQQGFRLVGILYVYSHLFI